MVSRRWIAAAALLCSGLMLSACSYTDGEYAFELDADELAGTWTSDEVSDVILELAVDGTVSAHADGTANALSWPENARCSGEGGAEYTSQLIDAPTGDFEGTWKFSPGAKGSSLPDIKIDVPDGDCPDGGLHGYLWRDVGDRVTMCFPLGLQDPDTFRWDRMLVLRLDGDQRSTDEKPCV